MAAPERVLGTTVRLRPSPANDVEVHVLSDEMLLYRSATEMAFSLNRTAKLVWDMCDGTRAVDEIATAIAERLQVPDAAFPQLSLDVRATVEEFARHGLLLDENG